MFRCDTSGRRPLPANDRFPKTKAPKKARSDSKRAFPMKVCRKLPDPITRGQKGGWKTASWLISGGFRHMTCDWTSGGTQRCWLAGTDLEMLVNIREKSHMRSLFYTDVRPNSQMLVQHSQKNRYKSSYSDRTFSKGTLLYLIYI